MLRLDPVYVTLMQYANVIAKICKLTHIPQTLLPKYLPFPEPINAIIGNRQLLLPDAQIFLFMKWIARYYMCHNWASKHAPISCSSKSGANELFARHTPLSYVSASVILRENRPCHQLISGKVCWVAWWMSETRQRSERGVGVYHFCAYQMWTEAGRHTTV